MWTGGNNYGRWTGDAITHMYAVDAIVCPDGLPHEPKFSHSAAMHAALASVAAEVVATPAQLDKGVPIGNGARGVTAFEYGSVAFLENAGNNHETVSYKGADFELPPVSSSLVKAGKTIFNSATVAQTATHRNLQLLEAAQTSIFPERGQKLWMWQQWSEPLLSSELKPGMGEVVKSEVPIEMTNLTHALSTFAFYETQLSSAIIALAAKSPSLSVASFEAMGLVAFVDGKLVGTAHEITHGNGSPKTLTLPQQSGPNAQAESDSFQMTLQQMQANGGGATLTILSEELGYANYGFTHQILKGIAPQADAVSLGGVPLPGPWSMRGGLAGEHLKAYDDRYNCASLGGCRVSWTESNHSASNRSSTWFKTAFVTPQQLNNGTPAGYNIMNAEWLLNIEGLQRGRVWLNGHEVGRYWTLERNNGEACPFGAPSCPTQQFYHLPREWLRPGPDTRGGTDVPPQYWNTLVVFEALGALNLDGVGLALAEMKSGDRKSVV